MTCIVAIKDKNKIYMGADSMACTSFTRGELKASKIIRKDNMIIGLCGSPRALQLLNYYWEVPKQNNQADDVYIYKTVTDSIMECFQTNLYAHLNNNQLKCGSDFIIGFNSNLYQFENNFQVLEPVNPYISTGSGSYHAMGSLYTTSLTKMKPNDRLQIALQAATEYVHSVGGKYQFEEL